LSIELNNINSKSYISSFNLDGDSLFTEAKRLFYNIRHTETVDFGLVSADGWEGYTTERIFEYGIFENSAQTSPVRITQTSVLPNDEPIVITELEFTNEGEDTVTIERPETNIHDGWVISRLPPLNNPTGSYRYHIEGEETRTFGESDLWYAHDLTADQKFVTYFGDDQAITTKYIDGPTEPIMAVTLTTADVENPSDLPTSEENPPARQTSGFSVDAVDLCVEGFSIEPGDTVSFTTSSMTHAGGDEAVARAEELTQLADSLASEIPELQDGPSRSSLTTVFQRFGGQSNNPLFIGGLSAGVLGLGYGVYRKLQSETVPKQEIETPVDEPSSGTEESVLSDSTPIIDSYSNINLGEVVETTDRVQIQYGTVDQQTVWVITPPEATDKTVDIEQISALSDQLELWAKMDSAPNLLSAYKVGRSPLPWAAVEQADYPALVDGVHQLDSGELLESLQQVCEAVHHVHRYGTVYENLTTDSVLYIGEGTVTLRGVLDAFDEPDPWYNAPEEFHGELTERSTVYRIGLIAYELFTRRLPYEEYPDGHPEEAVESEVTRSDMLSTEELPPALADELVKALSKNPADRHETVLHLRDSFSEIVSE
jgi:hypothetical protein